MNNSKLNTNNMAKAAVVLIIPDINSKEDLEKASQFIKQNKAVALGILSGETYDVGLVRYRTLFDNVKAKRMFGWKKILSPSNHTCMLPVFNGGKYNEYLLKKNPYVVVVFEPGNERIGEAVYGIPGGKIETKDSDFQCGGERELFEETGIRMVFNSADQHQLRVKYGYDVPLCYVHDSSSAKRMYTHVLYHVLLPVSSMILS